MRGGRLFCHSHTLLFLQGGVDDETSLTAYITAALLEMKKTIDVSFSGSSSLWSCYLAYF